HGVWEESAAAAPITLEGKIAGSLLVSSTQPDYFLPSRQTLVQDYADLIALAFSPEDFYDPECIELGVMPPQRVQQPYLTGFRQRLVDTMLQATRNQQPITITQAERLAWQDIEEKLLQVSFQSEEG
ncbi:MAG: GAF domain-containing protein, partial [Ktedonobacteraceae bacterium]